MSAKIAFVPLDDRPCTRDFPRQLATLLGWTVHLPPPALLGTFTTPGDSEGLAAWLRDALPGADGAILSVDMLAFGGLVASRDLQVDLETARARLRDLETVLAGHGTAVDVFSILMRVPPFCTSDRDRRFSSRLLEYSKRCAQWGEDDGRLASMRAAIPADFLERYEATRRRNHEINRLILGWARKKAVDFALIGMDDSRTEGFNVSERRVLEPLVSSRRSSVLPGADEIALLLLARRALAVYGERPRVRIHYSPPGFAHRVTRYEDRPVGELIDAHVRVIGLDVVEAGQDADIELYVNGCGGSQKEAAVQVVGSRPGRRHRVLVQEVGRAVEAGGLVAIADLAYSNGGDLALLAALGDAVELTRIASFAAWNTAGNTVGTVLAHAVLRWLQVHRTPFDPVGEAAHLRFLVERFLDDTLYQARVRQEVGVRLALERLNVYALGERHAAVAAQVGARMARAATEFFEQRVQGRQVRGGYRIVGPLHLESRLPWPRIFEIELNARFELALA